MTMNDNLPTKDFSYDERYLVSLVRANPILLEPMFEMAESIGKEFATIKTGDQAEEATLAAIEKTGHALLQAWASRRAEAVVSGYKPEKNVRPH